MISEIETTTDPVLSREDAIAILNTPDEELDQLIAQAEKLRRKYKGNHVSLCAMPKFTDEGTLVVEEPFSTPLT